MTGIREFIEARLAEDERFAREASGATVVGRIGIGNWNPSPAGDEWEACVSQHGDEELLVALRPGLPRPPQVMSGYWGAIVSTDPDQRGRDDASPVPALIHAARHDPARVLREVAAKRAILKQMGAVLDLGWDYYESNTVIDLAETALKNLAAAWSDHPDYETWDTT